jgi:hypothetical protein
VAGGDQPQAAHRDYWYRLVNIASGSVVEDLTLGGVERLLNEAGVDWPTWSRSTATTRRRRTGDTAPRDASIAYDASPWTLAPASISAPASSPPEP